MVVKPTLKPLDTGAVWEAFSINRQRGEFLVNFCQKIVDKHVFKGKTDILAALLESVNEAETTEEAFFIYYFVGGEISTRVATPQKFASRTDVKNWLTDDLLSWMEKQMSGDKEAVPFVKEIYEEIIKEDSVINKLKQLSGKYPQQEEDEDEEQLPLPGIDTSKKMDKNYISMEVHGDVTMTPDKAKRIRKILFESEE